MPANYFVSCIRLGAVLLAGSFNACDETGTDGKKSAPVPALPKIVGEWTGPCSALAIDFTGGGTETNVTARTDFTFRTDGFAEVNFQIFSSESSAGEACSPDFPLTKLSYSGQYAMELTNDKEATLNIGVAELAVSFGTAQALIVNVAGDSYPLPRPVETVTADTIYNLDVEEVSEPFPPPESTVYDLVAERAQGLVFGEKSEADPFPQALEKRPSTFDEDSFWSAP